MQKISFHIDHLDFLGQGVFKKDKDIYFISKTLPEEKGQAYVERKKKGVYKAHVASIEHPSPKRISPHCSHYKECPACHYLHCSYEDEIAFKKQSLARHLKALNIDQDIEVIPASIRDGYRNRVQFHYDVKKDKIGYLDIHSKNIIQVPNCLIMTNPLKKYVDENLKKKNWSIQAKKNGILKGHVEFFWKEDKVLVSFNKPYSKGGFVQVNSLMNNILKKTLKPYLDGNILELFAGSGELTEKYKQGEVLCVDIYKQKKRESSKFISLNLYNEKSLIHYLSLEKPFLEIDTLLLNPPRSGFLYLKDWVKRLNPKRVIYVSCHPATMVRDLKSITNSLQSVYLIDFFPSTYHFETMAVINMQDN